MCKPEETEVRHLGPICKLQHLLHVWCLKITIKEHLLIIALANGLHMRHVGDICKLWCLPIGMQGTSDWAGCADPGLQTMKAALRQVQRWGAGLTGWVGAEQMRLQGGSRRKKYRWMTWAQADRAVTTIWHSGTGRAGYLHWPLSQRWDAGGAALLISSTSVFTQTITHTKMECRHR